MQNKLRLSFLCLPFLAGCSYLFPSHDQKNFKADAPPKQATAQAKTAQQLPAASATREKATDKTAPQQAAIPNEVETTPPEKVISGNQPLHKISPLAPADPTAMENNSNPTIQPNGTVGVPPARDDYTPALSARQQERQAAIKLRDSLERIQNGHANNSEEDRQLSELPSSQRKAMLEQLNQALAK